MHRGVTGGFSFATAFLAKPFTVNGYKVLSVFNTIIKYLDAIGFNCNVLD